MHTCSRSVTSQISAQSLTCRRSVSLVPNSSPSCLCLSSVAFPGKVTRQTYACGGRGCRCICSVYISDYSTHTTFSRLVAQALCAICTVQSTSTEHFKWHLFCWPALSPVRRRRAVCLCSEWGKSAPLLTFLLRDTVLLQTDYRHWRPPPQYPEVTVRLGT